MSRKTRLMGAEIANDQSVEDEHEQMGEDNGGHTLGDSEGGGQNVEEPIDHVAQGEEEVQHNLIAGTNLDNHISSVSMRADSMQERAPTIILELQQGVGGNLQDKKYSDEHDEFNLEEGIDKIPERISEGTEEICFICMETIGEPQQDGTIEHTVTTKCGHSFGSACLATWLQHDISCPMCRRRSPMDDEAPADDDWQAEDDLDAELEAQLLAGLIMDD